MADYSDSKFNSRSSFPIDAVDAQEWTRLEPIITPDQLKRRYLFGIPLVSSIIDPITKKAAVMTNEDVKDHILYSIGQFEVDSSIDIFPVKREERHAFDRQLLNAWGHFRLNYAPIISVDELSLASGQSTPLYTFPLDWVDAAYFNKGLVYFTPLLPNSSIGLNSSVINTSGGAAFLQVMMSSTFMPATWLVKYTSGFKDAIVPRIVNDVIACYAAIDILSILATTKVNNTASLGLDGLSQSISTPGTETFNPRIQMLDEKRKKLLNKIKNLYGRKFVMGNV